MGIQLRILLIIISFLTVAYLIRKIKKSQMKIEDSIYWIFISGVFLILSIFPKIAIVTADWIGIESPANLVFLTIIFCFFIKMFSQSIKMSQMEWKISNLTQEVALKDIKEKKD